MWRCIKITVFVFLLCFDSKIIVLSPSEGSDLFTVGLLCSIERCYAAAFNGKHPVISITSTRRPSRIVLFFQQIPKPQKLVLFSLAITLRLPFCFPVASFALSNVSPIHQRHVNAASTSLSYPCRALLYPAVVKSHSVFIKEVNKGK